MRARHLMPSLAAVLLCVVAVAFAHQGADETEEERLERLRSLPYAAWSPEDPTADERSGVTRYVPGRVSPGVNLYALPNRGEARLVAMDGRLVHSWASAIGQPGPDERVPGFFFGWQHVRLAANGDLLAIVSRDRLLRLGSDSSVRWNIPLLLHHDIVPGADGSVHTIVDKPRVLDRSGRKRLVIDNEIVSFDAQGHEQRRLSMVDLLATRPSSSALLEAALERSYAGFTDLSGFLARSSGAEHAEEARLLLADPRLPELERAFAGELPAGGDRELVSLLRLISRSPAERIHTNALVVLDRHVAGLGEAGQILVSMRNLNLLAVVDPKEGRLVWSWGPGQVEGQHQPSILPNGHLLLFDNRISRKRSRVVEMAPETGRIVWSYEGTESEPFFSALMGGCQGLPNGNVLIVESEAGRAFEITRAGEIVWEFLNPERSGNARAVIYRMERIGPRRAAAFR